jgi:transketolase
MGKRIYDILENIVSLDSSAIILSADMFNSEYLKRNYPSQVLNAGLSETNSVSIAAGMSFEGKRIFLYCVSGFTVERAYEQLKYCIGACDLPVYIICTGFGWDLCQVGRGHHPTSDLLLMKTIPNMQIDIPASFCSAEEMLNQKIIHPHYMRLGCTLENSKEIQGNKMIVASLGSCYDLCFKAFNEFDFSSKGIGLIPIEHLDENYIKNIISCYSGNTKYFLIEDHLHLHCMKESFINNGGEICGVLSLPAIIEEISYSPEKLKEAYGFGTKQIAENILTSWNVLA